LPKIEGFWAFLLMQQRQSKRWKCFNTSSAKSAGLFFFSFQKLPKEKKKQKEKTYRTLLLLTVRKNKITEQLNNVKGKFPY